MAQTQYTLFLFNTQQYLRSLKAPNSCFIWSMLHLTRLSHFIAQEEIPDCARWNERCKTSLIHSGNPEASSYSHYCITTAWMPQTELEAPLWYALSGSSHEI